MAAVAAVEVAAAVTQEVQEVQAVVTEEAVEVVAAAAAALPAACRWVAPRRRGCPRLPSAPLNFPLASTLTHGCLSSSPRLAREAIRQ